MKKIEFDVSLKKAEHNGENYHYHSNFINDKIFLMLNGFKVRKNVSVKKLAKQLNYIYICELFCLYGQYHEKNFLRKCNGGTYQDECRINKILEFGGISFW